MSEEKAVQPWKPEDAVAKLKERIRLEFAAMIPPEQFAAMVRSVIDDFSKTKDRNSYHTPRYSDFDEIVRQELTEATKEEVKKFLARPEWTGKWEGQGYGISDRIAEIIKEQGPTILNNWLAQSIQMIVKDMQNRRTY